MAVRALAASVSLGLVVYIGYLWTTVRGVNDVPRLNVQAISGNGANGAGNGGGSTGSSGSSGNNSSGGTGQDENILIAGNDDRSQMTNAQVRELKVGRDGGSLNTDTMMIVHVPADGSRATLISLPRDSYVAIPGYGMNRLNAAYSDGYNNAQGSADAKRAAGMDLLIRTVDQLTGLQIDHFVLVSLMGFVTISDAIGGVPVNLCASVNDTVAHNQALGITGGSGLVLSKGYHVIKGVTALEFVRQRHGLKLGDISRTARQRYFLTAAFRKVASAGMLLNIGKLRSLVGAIKQSMFIDQNLSVFDLARQMSDMSANNIVGKVIPFVRFWNNSPVGDVEQIDPAQVQRFVRTIVQGSSPSSGSAYSTAKTVDPSGVSVRVLNAGTVNGGAGQAAATLRKAGFTTTAANAPSTSATSVIEYPAGQEAQAKTLAQYVPHAQVREDSGVSGVTLLLGSDATAVDPTPTAAGTSSASKASKAPAHKPVDAGCIN